MTCIWEMDDFGGTQLSSRDYFKEVCIVPFKLHLMGYVPDIVGQTASSFTYMCGVSIR